LGGGPPSFTRSSTSSVLLWYASQRLFRPSTYGAITRSGRTFQTVWFGLFQLKAPATPGRILVWAHPLSLAATYGIDVSFSSCGYLDVSVPRVRSTCPMRSGRSHHKWWGFPIRKSPDQLLFAKSPALIAGCRVLRRLSMPRHPPYTLKSLTTFTYHRHEKSTRLTTKPDLPVT